LQTVDTFSYKERSELCFAFITLVKNVFALKSRFRISFESHDKTLSCSS